MRIIAGSARRVSLEVAEASTTRPFLEMTRGALFNSLGQRVVGAAVLDLYAGSGALGLEALSRGALSCLFVERDPAAYACLLRNIAACRFGGEARAVREDVGKALAGLAGAGMCFELVFIDPPFPELSEWRADGRSGDVMRWAAACLAPEGNIIFRIEENKTRPPEWPGLELSSERRYGRSGICRYRRLTPAGENRI